MELSAVETGQGPPLVLLHGFTGNHTSWNEGLSEILSERRTLAVDLPGHGDSALAEPGEPCDLAAVAHAIDRLLDRHGVNEADFIGYSMGGRALLHLAHHFPERVSTMVILSASPGIEDPVERQRRAAADDALASRIETEGLENFVTQWMSQPLFQTLADADPERVLRERNRKLAGDAGSFAQALRCMTPGRQPSLWADLGCMEMPALVVAGALDEKYCKISRRMAGELVDAKSVIIPHAGHALLLENPTETAATVAAFFATRSGS